jgi:Tol biopolymer transport system component
MKKLLMGSAALILFSISIVVVQASCSKEASAGNDDDNGGKGKLVLYRKSSNSSDPSEIEQLWLMESNGSNKRRVNLVFPGNDYFVQTGRLVDNGTKIIITVSKINETGDNYMIFYKCNLDGSGLHQLFRGEQFENYQLQDVY